MARWKREFRKWAKAQGMPVYFMPRKPDLWEHAKLMSQMTAFILATESPPVRTE